MNVLHKFSVAPIPILLATLLLQSMYSYYHIISPKITRYFGPGFFFPDLKKGITQFPFSKKLQGKKESFFFKEKEISLEKKKIV